MQVVLVARHETCKVVLGAVRAPQRSLNVKLRIPLCFGKLAVLLLGSVMPAQIVCVPTSPDPIANPPLPPVVPGFAVGGGYSNLAPPVPGTCPPTPSQCRFWFDFVVTITAAAPPAPALDLCYGFPLQPPLVCALLTNPPWNVTNPPPPAPAGTVKLVANGVKLSVDCGGDIEWSIRASGVVPAIVFAHLRFHCSGC